MGWKKSASSREESLNDVARHMRDKRDSTLLLSHAAGVGAPGDDAEG